MISIKDFTEKENLGLVSLVRITEDALAFSTKSFDPTTGEELPETVVGGNLQEYKDRVVALKAELKELEAFIAKVGALEVQNKAAEPVITK